jgi:predicted membrane-bound spermidine synthase
MKISKLTLLPVIVFITGAAVLIIEVSATRILAPYFGNTLFSVSSIISVILGALSIGYYLGGIFVDKYPKFLVFFFLISIAGVFSLLIQVFSKTILPALGYSFDIRTGPLITSLVLFFSPSLILGMISPFAIKLKSFECNNIGKVSGSIFFWSTLGSIAGSLMTGFLLIPHFGISKIIISTGLLLVIIGFIGFWFSRNDDKNKWFRRIESFLFLMVPILILQTIFLSKPNPFVFQKDGLYSQITVRDTKINNKDARVLNLDLSDESAIFLESEELPFEYTRYYILYKIINPQAEKVLFLGGGSYSTPRKILLDENFVKRVDVVEIEPELYQIAKQYFRLQEDPRLFSYISDGRRFLKDVNQKYDVIFADVYYSLFSIPIHFTTEEFFELAKDKVSEDGFFLMNIIGSLDKGDNLFLLSEIKTFQSVFTNSYFFAVDSPNKKGLQNFIFVGLKDDTRKFNLNEKEILQSKNEIIRNLSTKIVDLKTLDLNSGLILTDDFAPVEYLISKNF